MNKRRINFVLSTHWDREWRESQQELRYDLVRLMDRVLAGLVDGRMHGPYFTDGQSIVVDDYLEIRPEQRDLVRRLAGEGKLNIGPWLTMPDLFTVSGESLIRNLLMGRQGARALGGTPSCAGFVCDMFGHNSQMPQIFSSCGIKGVLLWRGVNAEKIGHKRNFRWRGADGTEIAVHRFGPNGYGSYAGMVRDAWKYNQLLKKDQFVENLEKYLDYEMRQTEIEPVLCIDTCDHLEWDQNAYRMLFDFAKDHEDEMEIVHTSLDSFVEEMAAQKASIKPLLEGELREPAKGFLLTLDGDTQWVIPGVLSSRVWMKLANRECESLLCQWAEPFAAIARAVIGLETPPGFFDQAWRFLLTNHAHDSIDGCSVDQVHKDMAYRFDQCRLIAGRLAKEATQRIAASIEGDLAKGEVRLTLFNPLPRAFDGVTEVALRIPSDSPMFQEFFGFEPKPSFRIYTPDGKEVPYQRLGQTMHQIGSRIPETQFMEGVGYHQVRVAFLVQIAPFGYTSLTVRSPKPPHAGWILAEKASDPNLSGSIPTRYPVSPGMATSARSMENEHLSVTIEANGTLMLLDKRTKQTYRDLLTFEDSADIGDGWYHGMATNDQVYNSSASASQIVLLHDGPLMTRFRIRTTMSIPREFQFGPMTRSNDYTDLIIESELTLRPDQDYLEISTSVNNQANDHRLRVLFPSNVYAKTYLADTPFDVVERPIALREDNHLYHELELETKPQQSWTAVFESKRGLAVVADGLLETAVRDIADRTLALTLFRATKRTAFTNGEPGGQVRGPMSFRYLLVPLNGAPDRVLLCERGQRITAGLRCVQQRTEDLGIYRTAKVLPPSAGFFQVEGPVVVTSIRQIEQRIEMRLFNPNTTTAEAQIDLGQMIGRTKKLSPVSLIDFEGNSQGENLPVDGKGVKLTLKPKQICTIRFDAP